MCITEFRPASDFLTFVYAKYRNIYLWSDPQAKNAVFLVKILSKTKIPPVENSGGFEINAAQSLIPKFAPVPTTQEAAIPSHEHAREEGRAVVCV